MKTLRNGLLRFLWVRYQPEAPIMDCRDITFSADKSRERIDHALRVFPRKLLMRVLAFALHLLGAGRKEVAALVDMPEESVKTLLRLVMRDGFPALRDRRCTASAPAPHAAAAATAASVQGDGKGWTIELGTCGGAVHIPITHPLQARTLVLSLVNAQVLPVQQCAAALDLSPAHCRTLARELADRDVAQALLDKRVGQQRDYRVGPAQKAQIIQQWAARTVTGRSTSSAALAREVNALTESRLSARTVRWHLQHLGLSAIRDTLPQLVETLKKTPTDRG
jgi:hypothetical protein